MLKDSHFFGFVYLKGVHFRHHMVHEFHNKVVIVAVFSVLKIKAVLRVVEGIVLKCLHIVDDLDDALNLFVDNQSFSHRVFAEHVIKDIFFQLVVYYGDFFFR